jgi:hypothetical protein
MVRRAVSTHQPSRQHLFFPEIDASVSTRVVSWNEAAETNESVESDDRHCAPLLNRRSTSRHPGLSLRITPGLSNVPLRLAYECARS